ncbi:unnamed protein product [Microthlaspi erraticum]|uniref:Protein phosphatase inhibitor n=1 Tax=Microthlaspi erraticum TaxID=1685480 RepID=A0A6D2IGV0_9BRAS|nr:unnamed protein product [Microthlaspi erraticum]
MLRPLLYCISQTFSFIQQRSLSFFLLGTSNSSGDQRTKDFKISKAKAMSTATRPSSSATTSVILENPIPQSQPTERLVLRLNRKKKTVSWKDGTVDNEFMQKKSSKKCCIFHKQKPFDEDDSEEEDNDDHHHHHHDHDHNHVHSESDEASSSNDSKAVD